MAQEAIDKLHDTSLGDRLIFVREDREPERPTAPTAVFVTNVRNITMFPRYGLTSPRYSPTEMQARSYSPRSQIIFSLPIP